VTASARHLSRGETDHERLWLGTGVAATIALVAMQGTTGLPPLLCPVKAISGWPCVGCGTMRAVAALLEGACVEALQLNPLVPVATLAWAIWACYAATVLVLRLPRLRVTLTARDLSLLRRVTVVAVVCVWGFLVFDGR
jgi:hypothetical protein